MTSFLNIFVFNKNKVKLYKFVVPSKIYLRGAVGNDYFKTLIKLKFKASSFEQAIYASNILYRGVYSLYKKSHKASKEIISQLQELDNAWDIINYCGGKLGESFKKGLYMCFFKSLEQREPVNEHTTGYVDGLIKLINLESIDDM